MRRAWLAAALASSLAGCGGGAPLLHGAHALENGLVTLGAGASGELLAGDASRDLQAARAVPLPGPVTAAQRAAYAKGAAAIVGASPGIAPWVGARLGLPYTSELGLTYSGRNARLDLRHAFESGSVALSVGAGASAVLSQRSHAGNPELAGLSTNGASGFGVDVPLLVGWRSKSEIVSVWAGPRAGWERIGGSVGLGVDPAAPGDLSGEPPDVDASARHLWAGGVVGFQIGFRHLHGAIELDAAWHRIAGTIGGVDVKTGGVSLAPSAALITRF